MSEKASLKTEPIPWRLWIKSPAYLKLTPEKKIKSLLTIIERKEKHSVDVDVLQQKLQEATELLKEVVEKRGAYSQNHLVHAENVINNASEKASKVTVILSELLVGLELEEAKK